MAAARHGNLPSHRLPRFRSGSPLCALRMRLSKKVVSTVRGSEWVLGMLARTNSDCSCSIVREKRNRIVCHPESAAADEGSPAMHRTYLLRPGTPAHEVKVPRERALPAVFSNETSREILRPKEGLRMTVLEISQVLEKHSIPHLACPTATAL